MKLRLIAYCLVVFVFFIGCKEIEPEIVSVIQSPNKVVLIEDFTGVQCPNCPKAAKEISRISMENEGKIITVSVHTKDLIPSLTKPYSESKYDFRLSEADVIGRALGVGLGLPTSSFDRIYFNELPSPAGRSILFPTDYQSAFNIAVVESPEVNLSIAKEYNPDTRQLNISLNVVAVEDTKEELYYTIYIIESELIDVQYDGDNGGKIKNYEHNHILRKILTPPLGELFTSSLKKLESIKIQESFTIPQDTLDWWNPENMSIVAFVHRGQGEDRSVLQVDEVEVVE